jgi:hypothetical protein
VEELFAAFRSAQQIGCRQVWAIYDQALGHPLALFFGGVTARFGRHHAAEKQKRSPLAFVSINGSPQAGFEETGRRRKTEAREPKMG